MFLLDQQNQLNVHLDKNRQVHTFGCPKGIIISIFSSASFSWNNASYSHWQVPEFWLGVFWTILPYKMPPVQSGLIASECGQPASNQSMHFQLCPGLGTGVAILEHCTCASMWISGALDHCPTETSNPAITLRMTLTLLRFVVPVLPTQPHNVMDPAPNFAVGTKFFSWNALRFFPPCIAPLVVTK